MTQIKQHTLQSGERILMVPYPEEATDLAGATQYSLFYWTKTCTQSMGDYPYSVPIPQGNWQLIGLSDEITEEMAKYINLLEYCVDPWDESITYLDYIETTKYKQKRFLITDFKKSLLNFMQSIGCVGRHAILKESKNHEI